MILTNLKTARALGLVASLTLWVAAASALEVPPRPEGPVSDYARALSPEARARLDAQLRSYEQGTQQIAIAIFPALESESLEDFSMRLAERWKIGGKKSSDGVLVTVFLAERKVRMEVGYGLEGNLPDALCARIIREIIGPHFQRGDLEGGLRAAIATIDTATTGRPHPEGESLRQRPRGRRAAPAGPFETVMLLIFVAVMIIGGIARARRGGRSGFGGPTIFIGGSSGWSSWGGGGSDSGGWSGGGGSFGGGGASGDW